MTYYNDYKCNYKLLVYQQQLQITITTIRKLTAMTYHNDYKCNNNLLVYNNNYKLQ